MLAMAAVLCAAGVAAWITFPSFASSLNIGTVAEPCEDSCGTSVKEKPKDAATHDHAAEVKEKPKAAAAHDHAAEVKEKPKAAAAHDHAAEKNAVVDGAGKEKSDSCAETSDDPYALWETSDESESEKPAGIIESAALASLDTGDAVAGAATVGEELEGPGEINFNDDRLAHISPLVSCTAVEVRKSLGDSVEAGEPLAIMHSSDLGAAQIDYLSAEKNLELAKIERDRMRTINQSTLKLLELLRQEATPEKIGQEMRESSVGATKGKLLTRYAALRHGDAAFARAKKLREGKVISEGDFELAAREVESARAEYDGAFEDAVFDTRESLVKAEKAHQVSESALLNAAWRLRNMGVSTEEITALGAGPVDGAAIARYTLSSKIPGVVTSRHLSVGEHIEVDKDSRDDCFVVADLSTVWCDIRLSPAEHAKAAIGQKVALRFAGETLPVEGRVIAVSPTIDPGTRSGSVRALFENPGRKLRPGLFVDAIISSGGRAANVAVPVEAMQTLNGQDVVFVKGGCAEEFKAFKVSRGVSNKRLVEILSGVNAGDRVVTRNAFVLKAELAKGSATGCAGGH